MKKVIAPLLLLTIISGALLFMNACNKEKTPTTNASAHFNKTAYYPLEIATFTYAEGIEQTDFSATIQNINCLVKKVNDSTAALYIPSISAGSYEVSMLIRNKTVTAPITVLSNPAIPDVNVFITNIQQQNALDLNKVKVEIDTVEAWGITTTGSYDADVAALESLNNQITSDINNLNAADKQALANLIAANPLIFLSDDTMSAYIDRLLLNAPAFFKTDQTTTAVSDVIGMYNMMADFGTFFFDVYRPAITGAIVGLTLGLSPPAIAATAIVTTIFWNKIKAKLLSLKLKLKLAWDLVVNFKWYTEPINGLRTEIDGIQVSGLASGVNLHNHKEARSNIIPGQPVNIASEIKRRNIQSTDINSPYVWLNDFLTLYNKAVTMWNEAASSLFGSLNTNYSPVNYKGCAIKEADFLSIQVINNAAVTATYVAGTYPDFDFLFNNTSGTLQNFQYKIKFNDGIIQTETPPINATISLTEPSLLVYESGNNQSGALGSQLTDPISVIVKDQAGNPFNGAKVYFTAHNGGTVTDAQITTGADGIARVGWTLGASGNTHSVTVTAYKNDNTTNLQGSPFTFNATACDAHTIDGSWEFVYWLDQATAYSGTPFTSLGYYAFSGNGDNTGYGPGAGATVSYSISGADCKDFHGHWGVINLNGNVLSGNLIQGIGTGGSQDIYFQYRR